MEIVKIDSFDNNSKKYLKFTFNGELEPNEAKKSINQWKDIFYKNPDSKFIIIWDCLNMKGYNNESRILWQNALKDLKSQINFIYIISTSRLFKIAAAVMTLVTDITLKNVSSESEITY